MTKANKMLKPIHRSMKEHFELVTEYLELPGSVEDKTPFNSLRAIKKEFNKTKKLLREATKK